MKKEISLIILIYILSSCTVVTDFQSLSKSIYQKQKMEHCGLYPSLIYSHCNQLKDRIGFINYQQDTIYSLLMFDMETGYIYRTIWNKRGNISYISLGKKIEEYDTNVFTKRLYDILENWELRVIKQKELDLSPNIQINDGGMYSALRVIIHNNKIQIKCKNFEYIEPLE